MTLTVDSAFVCDEVRREDSGKLILIGVYAQDIGLGKLPASIALQLVVRVHATEATESAIEFRCMFDGEERARRGGRLKVLSPGHTILATPHLFIENIEKDATLQFEWRLGKEDQWKPFYSIPVLQRSGPIPTIAP